VKLHRGNSRQIPQSKEKGKYGGALKGPCSRGKREKNNNKALEKRGKAGFGRKNLGRGGTWLSVNERV